MEHVRLTNERLSLQEEKLNAVEDTQNTTNATLQAILARLPMLVGGSRAAAPSIPAPPPFQQTH